ncbi:MAG: discoidin domain-containing protein, partial [Isosphaeraceae bacterium]
MRIPRSFQLAAVIVTLAIANSSAAEPDPKPIRALLVCGGCCHDYDAQKTIIKNGLAERAHIEVTVVQQGGTTTDTKIPLYENPDWAKGYDVVLHDECFSGVGDPEWTRRILKPHKDGLPGVVIHCAMHCYRDGTDQWFQFCGVTSRRHGKAYPHEVLNQDPQHPIMSKFGPAWANPAGELYWIEKVWPTAHPLAVSKNQEKGNEEVCVWTNQYEKARVFGTTLGHHNETVSSDAYLDLLTRGTLWACDKLNDQYLKPPKARVARLNHAKGRPATASSEETAKQNLAAKAFDGDANTRWCAANGSKNQWLQVDLGKPTPLTGVRLDWEQPATAYQFRVEGSDDGKAWHPLIDGSKNEKAGPRVLDFLPGEARARHVRVTFLGSKSGGWGSLHEVEVYGKETVVIEPEDPNRAARTAEAAMLSQNKLPEGYDATVFAAPPTISYPVFVAAATDGDVYVSVDQNGSLDRAANRGSVARLRDVDGDGRADEVTRFVANVDSPRGLVWDHDRVYLMHPPHLSAFIDHDGDGKADEQKILVKNIAFTFKDRPADHTSNGVTMGIDGWLYL